MDENLVAVTNRTGYSVALVENATGRIVAETDAGGIAPFHVFVFPQVVVVVNQGDVTQQGSIRTFRLVGLQ